MQNVIKTNLVDVAIDPFLTKNPKDYFDDNSEKLPIDILQGYCRDVIKKTTLYINSVNFN